MQCMSSVKALASSDTHLSKGEGTQTRMDEGFVRAIPHETF